MAQIVDDDTDAFGELYDRYSGRAYGLARTVCREPVLAEEAVQDGFLSVGRAGAATPPNAERSRPGY